MKKSVGSVRGHLLAALQAPRLWLLAGLLLGGMVTARAGGPHFHHYGWRHYPALSFYYNAGPYYAPIYYPSYGFESGYVRPNYAVSGTLLGALTGGLIGNSIHHQGWEGAGIGAAAGLVLGGLAEHSARVQEQNYQSRAATPMSQAGYVSAPPPVPSPATSAVAPSTAESPATASAPARSSSSNSANRLFGR